jgi:hypothetical protein
VVLSYISYLRRFMCFSLSLSVSSDPISLTLAVAQSSLPSSATLSTMASYLCGRVPSLSPPPPPMSTYSPRGRLVALCRGDDCQRRGRPHLQTRTMAGGVDARPGTSSLVGDDALQSVCADRAGSKIIRGDLSLRFHLLGSFFSTQPKNTNSYD